MNQSPLHQHPIGEALVLQEPRSCHRFLQLRLQATSFCCWHRGGELRQRGMLPPLGSGLRQQRRTPMLALLQALDEQFFSGLQFGEPDKIGCRQAIAFLSEDSEQVALHIGEFRKQPGEIGVESFAEC